jgi:hypothetical protein
MRHPMRRLPRTGLAALKSALPVCTAVFLPAWDAQNLRAADGAGAAPSHPLSLSNEHHVQISCTVDCLFYDSDTPAESGAVRRSYLATCTLGTAGWRIDIDSIAGVATSWLFDGTNVYESLRPLAAGFESAATKRLGLPTVPAGVASSNVTINVTPSVDGQPLGKYWVNIAWLAFCSGSYLKRPDRLVSPPIADLRYSPDAFAYADKTTVFDDELGLPTTIQLFASKSLFQTSVTNQYFFGNRNVDAWTSTIARIHHDRYRSPISAPSPYRWRRILRHLHGHPCTELFGILCRCRQWC